MRGKYVDVVVICVLLTTAGCTGFIDNSNQPITSRTTEEVQTSEITGRHEQKPEFSPTATVTVTSEERSWNRGSENSSYEYTHQFERLVRNKSLNVSELNNPYSGGEYDTVELDVINVQTRSIPPDDQNILVISQSVNETSGNTLRRTVGKISIIFATVLKRETINNEGDWNVSQARVLTYKNDDLIAKNRIEWDWASNWVFERLTWDLSGYLNHVGSSTERYRSNENKHSSSPEHKLETRIEVNSVDNNITNVHVNKSGALFFLSYATETPPTRSHTVTRLEEYDLIISQYGKLAVSDKFNRYNKTTIFIEEVYHAPNGTYDTRRIYTINSTFARRVYRGTVNETQVVNHLLDRVSIELDEYYE